MNRAERVQKTDSEWDTVKRNMGIMDGFQALIERNVFIDCSNDQSLRVHITSTMDNGDSEAVNVVADYPAATPTCWDPPRELRKLTIFLDGSIEYFVLQPLWAKGQVMQSEGLKEKAVRDISSEDYERLEKILEQAKNPNSHIRHYHSPKLFS